LNRIGIIGSGQLGWMMILESKPLGIGFNVFDTEPGPAASLADAFFTTGSENEFVGSSDFVTYEFEHVSDLAIKKAENDQKLSPNSLAINLKKERYREKEFLRNNGFPIADFYVANSLDDAKRKAGMFEKAVVKSSSGGYDGKGQSYIDKLNKDNLSMIADTYVIEEYIDYDFEASIIMARDRTGKKIFFDPSLNVNYSGMLLYNSSPVQDYGMREIASKLSDALNYVGVLSVEFFIKGGKPIINEFAPRVHNSGHHTLLGSSISQFEQHIRAVAGLPLMIPKLFCPSGILNIVGRDLDNRTREKILDIDGSRIYWYGKQVRRRRKVGHVNLIGDDRSDLESKIEYARDILYGDHIADCF